MEVFISHADADKDIAENIKELIENAGAVAKLSTYEIDPTKTVINKIKDAIRNSDVGVILWTKNSKGREWILQEAGALAITNKPLTVFVADDTEPMGGIVKDLQYIRLNDEHAIEQYVTWIKKTIKNELISSLLLIIVGGIALWWFSKKFSEN